MRHRFTELRRELAPGVAGLERRQFLILEVGVGLEVEPYAQVARELDGTWYCEIVSTNYLPERAWPIDEYFLMSMGWEPPSDPRDNWSITALNAADATHLVVEALRFGRACTDPRAYSWWFGRFPPDDGGGGDDAPLLPRDGFGLAA